MAWKNGMHWKENFSFFPFVFCIARAKIPTDVFEKKTELFLSTVKIIIWNEKTSITLKTTATHYTQINTNFIYSIESYDWTGLKPKWLNRKKQTSKTISFQNNLLWFQIDCWWKTKVRSFYKKKKSLDFFLLLKTRSVYCSTNVYNDTDGKWFWLFFYSNDRNNNTAKRSTPSFKFIYT